MLLMLVGVANAKAQEKTVKFQAEVTSGTIDVKGTIFSDYSAELTLPQDDQYIGHDVTVSMGFYGATGLGIASGTSRSFTKNIDLTPYVKGYIGQILTESMVNDLIDQMKGTFSDEEIESLIDKYVADLDETKLNSLIDNTDITLDMVDKILPNPLTKDDVDGLVADFSITLTGDEETAYNNWSSLTAAQQEEALTEIRVKILEGIESKIGSVQGMLKSKAKALSFTKKKSIIVDYIESLSADEKKAYAYDYLDGLDDKKAMVVEFINNMSDADLATLIDQVAADMQLNAQALLEKACEFAGVGTAWISEVMNPIYGFTQTAANVKVVDGKKTTGFKYIVKGDSPSTKNTKITAEPDNLANAQAAWSMVAEHLQGTTQTVEDNKIKIVKGTYVQFGDQRLKFIKDLNLFEGGMNWTLSKDNLVNNATEIYASILDAVEIENTNMETTDAANTYIVAAYMPKGSDIHFGSSVLTLKDNCRVELDAKEAAAQAPEASEALSQEITEVRNLILNSVGKRAKVKAVAHYGLAMFTRAFAIADGSELDLRIIFAPDCDVNRDGRVTADDVPALVNNILGKDAENKNDHETNIDGGESDVQSLGDLTKLINVLKTLGAVSTPAISVTPEP